MRPRPCMHIYSGTLPRLVTLAFGIWLSVRAGQGSTVCGLLDERKSLAAKGHCVISCSPGTTGEKLPTTADILMVAVCLILPLSETEAKIMAANHVGRCQQQ